MTTIVTRAGKGSPLTHTEVDTNFTNLNTNKLETAAIPLGTLAAPSISFVGDANTGIYSPGADTLAFVEGGAEAMRIDSSSRLLIGTSTARSNVYQSTLNITPQNQIESNKGGYSGGLSLTNCSADGYPAVLTFGQSYTNTLGGNALIANNQPFGLINFTGNDGTNFRTGASIAANVDGTSGAGDMPGRLVFSSTADGGSSPTEAMRINSQQELLVGTATRNANGGVLQLKSGITFPATAVAASDANTLDDYEEGTWTYNFTSTTGTITKDSTYVYGNYTKVGRLVTVTGFLPVLSVSSPTGTLTLTGLPFAIRSSSNREDFVGGGIYGSSLSATSVSPLMISGGKGDSSLTITKFVSGSQANLAGDVLADTRFQISFSYFTD